MLTLAPQRAQQLFGCTLKSLHCTLKSLQVTMQESDLTSYPVNESTILSSLRLMASKLIFSTLGHGAKWSVGTSAWNFFIASSSLCAKNGFTLDQGNLQNKVISLSALCHQIQFHFGKPRARLAMIWFIVIAPHKTCWSKLVVSAPKLICCSNYFPIGLFLKYNILLVIKPRNVLHFNSY